MGWRVRSRGHAVYSPSSGSAECEKFAKTPAGAVFQLARRTCSQQHRRIRLRLNAPTWIGSIHCRGVAGRVTPQLRRVEFGGVGHPELPNVVLRLTPRGQHLAVQKQGRRMAAARHVHASSGHRAAHSRVVQLGEVDILTWSWVDTVNTSRKSGPFRC